MKLIKNINLLQSLFKFNFNVLTQKNTFKAFNSYTIFFLKYKKLKVYSLLNFFVLIKVLKQYSFFLKNIKRQIVISTYSKYYFYLFNKFTSKYALKNIFCEYKTLRNNISTSLLVALNKKQNSKEIVKLYKNLSFKKLYLIFEFTKFTHFQHFGNYKIYKNISTWYEFFFFLLLSKKNFNN